MTRAAVDLGTNSMRLLLVDDNGNEIVRLTEVTGLGQGLVDSGRLADAAIERTIAVLQRFGQTIRTHGVTRSRAVATSASRDAANREEFFDQAERALGVRPELIPGEEEARLSFAGATAGLRDGSSLVVDIGGGSTEFVSERWAISIDIGSVRLTDLALPDRPARPAQLAAAAQTVEEMLATVDPPVLVDRVIGVAGTWTSLSAINLDLKSYDRSVVHHSNLSGLEIESLVTWLAGLSLEETAAIPALDPKRAPVILAGAVIARGAIRRLEVAEVLVSEHDLLDGVAASLA